MVFYAWLLLSCRAQDLGITLPPKGRLGIAQEDLKRDVWLAEHQKGHHWYIKRMSQMGLEVYADPLGVCVGTGAAKKIVVVDGDTLSSKIGKAVQISLAKATHNHKDKGDMDFCVYTQPPQAQEIWLKDLGGHDFVYEGREIFCYERATELRDIDFRKFVMEVQALAKALGIP